MHRIPEVEIFERGDKKNNSEISVPSFEERESRYRADREELINKAKLARDTKAKSYREFHVGCATLAWHPSRGYLTYDEGNAKPEEKVQFGSDLRCAERNALDKVKKDHCVRVVAFVIASNKLQPDHNKVMRETLMPCAECQKMFMENSELVDDDTILLAVNDQTIPEDAKEIVHEFQSETTVGCLLGQSGVRK